jgi:hypothetical protein
VGGQPAVRQARLELIAIEAIPQQSSGDRLPCDVGTVRMEVKSNPRVSPDADQGIAEVIARQVAHAPEVVLLGHGFGSA